MLLEYVLQEKKAKEKPYLPGSSVKVIIGIVIVPWELGEGGQMGGESSNKNEMGAGDIEEAGRYFSGTLKK